MKFAWVKAHKQEFRVALMCKALKVSRSGYYKWLHHKPSKRELRRRKITAVARKFHAESNGIYGYRKVLADIKKNTPDLACAPETLRLIMKSECLFSCVKRKWHKHGLNDDCYCQYADNELARNFTATAPNQKWVADITYIHTAQSWLYLGVVMDLFSRKIVGWSMSDSIDGELVCDALKNAIKGRKPGAGLLHHSDRGCQYNSSCFHRLLDKSGIRCSMSRKGNPWECAACL